MTISFMTPLSNTCSLKLQEYKAFISDSKLEDPTMMSAVLQIWKIHNPKRKISEKFGICANDHLGVQCTG